MLRLPDTSAHPARAAVWGILTLLAVIALAIIAVRIHHAGTSSGDEAAVQLAAAGAT